MKNEEPSGIPSLSWICGILAAIAVGFAYNNKLQAIYTAHPKGGGMEDAFILTAVFVAGFVLTGLLTRWK